MQPPVDTRAEVPEPIGIPGNDVEPITVHDQEAPSVGRRVDQVVCNDHVAETRADPLAERVVMVAGQVENLGSFPRPPEKKGHDIGVRLRPMKPHSEAPEIDDVADEVDALSGRPLQKGEQCFGVAALRTKVQVGQPHRPIMA